MLEPFSSSRESSRTGLRDEARAVRARGPRRSRARDSRLTREDVGHCAKGVKASREKTSALCERRRRLALKDAVDGARGVNASEGKARSFVQKASGFSKRHAVIVREASTPPTRRRGHAARGVHAFHRKTRPSCEKPRCLPAEDAIVHPSGLEASQGRPIARPHVDGSLGVSDEHVSLGTRFQPRQTASWPGAAPSRLRVRPG